jgi:hypothetical protein
MEEKKTNNPSPFDSHPIDSCLDQGFDQNLGQNLDHREGERRVCGRKGFTYITMVGWMCRREQIRRKDDEFSC